MKGCFRIIYKFMKTIFHNPCAEYFRIAQKPKDFTFDVGEVKTTRPRIFSRDVNILEF